MCMAAGSVSLKKWQIHHVKIAALIPKQEQKPPEFWCP